MQFFESEERVHAEEQAVINRFPQPLGWGLAKGAIMLGVVAALTWVAATALQNRAQKEGEVAMARERAIEQPADVVPPGTGTTPDGRTIDTAPAPTSSVSGALSR